MGPGIEQRREEVCTSGKHARAGTWRDIWKELKRFDEYEEVIVKHVKSARKTWKDEIVKKRFTPKAMSKRIAVPTEVQKWTLFCGPEFRARGSRYGIEEIRNGKGPENLQRRQRHETT